MKKVIPGLLYSNRVLFDPGQTWHNARKGNLTNG
jgi:hypothetical protein